MWNEPSEARLESIPRLYETMPLDLQDKLIHLHFFIGGCDWYIAEFDGEDTFFGFAVLNGDFFNAEWGYVSFSELKSINVNGIEIDCDLEEYWNVRRAVEVTIIKLVCRWE